MIFKSFRRLFTWRVLIWQAPDSSTRCQLPGKDPRKGDQRIESVSSCNSSATEASSMEDIDGRNLMAYLPHTLITSNLADKDRTHRLTFSHFLAEDPTIAVFSKSQDAAVPSAWRHSRSWRTWVNNICQGVRKGYNPFRPCSVWVIVGSRWQYKVSSKAVHYWSAADGLLLIDWNTMFDDYFMKEQKKKNKKRTHEIVKKFHSLEKKTLITETGALWKRYDDWDIHTPTAADVALACRYEGHGFEQGLAHLEDGVSVREVRSLLRQLYNALKTELDRRIAKKKKLLQRDGRTFRMQRGGYRSESWSSRGE